MVRQMDENAAKHRIKLFGLNDRRQGIVHVVGPEQGLTLPGLLIVCGDSHTSTHGALGAFAFGIGASEVAHVLMTQTIWQRRPKRMRITVDGKAAPGIGAKDIVLAIIAKIGADGATSHAIEFAGSAIRALSIEGRLTLCNMSIEAGARCGMVAPDQVTLRIRQRPALRAKRDGIRSGGRGLVRAQDRRRRRIRSRGCTRCHRDRADRHLGDQPGRRLADRWRACRIPRGEANPGTRQRTARCASTIWDLHPGQKLTTIAIDRVFIGSCTNARIEDLRAAAAVLAGRISKVPGLVSPGSSLVKRQAEAGRARPHLPRRRPGMGRIRLLDVRRHQRRSRRARRALRLDHQSQFPRPAGPRRAHASDVAGDGRGGRRDRASGRRAAAAGRPKGLSAMDKFTRITATACPLNVSQSQHRSDAAGALSQVAARGGHRQGAVPGPALRFRRTRAAGLPAQPAGLARTPKSSSAAAISVAAPRARPPFTRCTTTAFAA